MTRTERSLSPKALLKDRSESKSGMDKSMRKGGAGTHNWGSLADEVDLVSAAYEDALEERGLDAPGDKAKVVNGAATVNGTPESAAAGGSAGEARPAAPERSTSANSVTEEDRESAREYRRGALKNGAVDLKSIARTSAGASSVSPPTKPVVAKEETAVAV